MKRILSVFLAIILCMSMIFAVAADEVTAKKETFQDVAAETEVGKAIAVLASAGILSGDGDGNFRPHDDISRAELCKIVNLIFGYTEKDSSGFPDVPADVWYRDYVLIAKKAGYIKGFDDGTFRGDSKVTREQACVIIARAAGLKPTDKEVKIADEVAAWALDSVKLVIANGIMPLEKDNTFRATKNITRSEFSVAHVGFVDGTYKFNDQNEGKEDEKDDTAEKPETNTSSGSFGGGGGDTTFTVTFKNGSTVVSTASGLASGSTLAGKIPAAPTVPWGYEFQGWYSGTTQITEATAVAGNITATAKVTAKTYTIQFLSAGATEATVTYTRETTPVPSLITPAPRTGYVFGGWYTEENGQGTKASNNLQLTSSTAVTRTFYAYWADASANNTMVTKLQDVIYALDLHKGSFDRISNTRTEIVDPILTCLRDAVTQASTYLLEANFIKTTYKNTILEVKAAYSNLNDIDYADFMEVMGSQVDAERPGSLVWIMEQLGVSMPTT